MKKYFYGKFKVNNNSKINNIREKMFDEIVDTLLNNTAKEKYNINDNVIVDKVSKKILGKNLENEFLDNILEKIILQLPVDNIDGKNNTEDDETEIFYRETVKPENGTEIKKFITVHNPICKKHKEKSENKNEFFQKVIKSLMTKLIDDKKPINSTNKNNNFSLFSGTGEWTNKNNNFPLSTNTEEWTEELNAQFDIPLINETEELHAQFDIPSL